jgi:hypothetical protein
MAPEQHTPSGSSAYPNASPGDPPEHISDQAALGRWRRDRWSPQAALIAFAVWATAAALGWFAIGIAIALWITS